MKYFIGIDGGGTKTEFVLTDEQGNIVNRVLKSGCNPNDIGIDGSYRVLLDGIQEIAKGYQADDIYIFAGISGAGVANNALQLQSLLANDYPQVEVKNDLVNAVESCLNGEEGIAVICGTGISCCMYKDGVYTTIGGYGYLFEDGGSGYSYGRDAVKAAIQYEDGYGEETVLLSYLKARFQKSVRASLGQLLLGEKSAVASLCPLVFDGAMAGDKVCKDIIRFNLDCTVSLIENTVKLYKNPTCAIGFVGGLTKENCYRETMQSAFASEHPLLFSERKPVYGSVRKAALLAGVNPDETFMQNYDKR